MKQIKQFKYYGTNTVGANEPYDLTDNNLASGLAFSNYMPILHLSIQGKKNTIFYVNNGPYPIKLFSSDFQINFEEYGLAIKGLQFDKDSLSQYDRNDPLTITIIYDESQLGL